jgi:hypothetical protein
MAKPRGHTWAKRLEWEKLPLLTPRQSDQSAYRPWPHCIQGLLNLVRRLDLRPASNRAPERALRFKAAGLPIHTPGRYGVRVTTSA